MYEFKISEPLEKKFQKINNKNPKILVIIRNKILEIIQNPNRYKNLRNPLQKFKRVHIDKHFVLIFSINEKTKKVIFEDFNHHNDIYK